MYPTFHSNASIPFSLKFDEKCLVSTVLSPSLQKVSASDLADPPTTKIVLFLDDPPGSEPRGQLTTQ